MIVSKNTLPPYDEFKQLMKRTDHMLNAQAIGRDSYYKDRNGTQLEEDVYQALTQCALHTSFEGTISLISGASFPDIIASGFYGVEVKSTNKNHWKSIGSSILESTRNPDVKRIFLTFGKLGSPVSFKSRPYEECLSGISVTHYPRYQINMELHSGETIFDKMGVSYDALRSMENPVAPVSQYYKNQLKPGESLWWAADFDAEKNAAPPIVRLWSALSAQEKIAYTVKGYALFPEILNQHSCKKYQRYALWLATQCGIVNTNIRDQFSAGGQRDIVTSNGTFSKMPAALWRISENKALIIDTILSESPVALMEHWQVDSICENRIRQWCSLVASPSAAILPPCDLHSVLAGIFAENLKM